MREPPKPITGKQAESVSSKIHPGSLADGKIKRDQADTHGDMTNGLNRRSTMTEEGLAARYRAAFLAAGMPVDEVDHLLALYEQEKGTPSFPAWEWEDEMRRQKRMNLPRDDGFGWAEL